MKQVVKGSEIMKILIIIPAYNEEKNILEVCNKIEEYNKKEKTNYDVIVINDGSKDNTEKILVENNIKHISLINNLGIGGAVQTGYKYALENDYDIAIQFDGDGQHDAKYLNEMAKYLGIGHNRIRRLVKDNPDANYILLRGTRVYLKREMFVETMLKLSRL